jgi:hypothetical protein
LFWVRGMQQVEPCGNSPSFGNRGKTCEFWLVLATVVRLVSLWPLGTESNLGVWSCLDVV